MLHENLHQAEDLEVDNSSRPLKARKSLKLAIVQSFALPIDILCVQNRIWVSR